MSQGLPLEFAICFIVRGRQTLLVNRRFPPNMGMWNGIGGRLEAGEAPRVCILREVHEETGIALDDARFSGHVTWILDGGVAGGMYAFVARLPHEFAYPTPRATDEGLLDWKDVAWVVHPQNRGVVPNIPYFLPRMLDEETCYAHQFVFVNGHVTEYRAARLLTP
jgi:8-oxo-dGTP diphosphatase